MAKTDLTVIKEYCKKRAECKGCKLTSIGKLCFVEDSPLYWDLRKLNAAIRKIRNGG